MKKKALFVAALLGATTTFGQIESKNGYQVLPEEGDIALSFDAVPVIDFALNAVNIMNNTGATASHPGYVSGFNQILVGKYFVDAETAYRAKLGINTISQTTSTFYDDPHDVATVANSTTWGEVEDVAKTSTSQIVLGGGMEMRRGHNRLQGFYGGEILFAISSSKAKNTYGYAYDTQAETDGTIFNGDSRVLSSKSGGFGMSIRGFGGVEYFFAPKISFGAEFGWGLGFASNGRGTTETEYWDDPAATGTATQRVETTEGASSSSAFGFQVDNSGAGAAIFGGSAALTMNFHF